MKNNFLFVATFSNIFYNVVSILIGIMLIVFGVFKIIKNRKQTTDNIATILIPILNERTLASFIFDESYSLTNLEMAMGIPAVDIFKKVA